MTVDEEKKLAAEKAISYITPGMKVGLGSGSTSAVAVRLLGEKMKKEVKRKYKISTYNFRLFSGIFSQIFLIFLSMD